VCCCVVLCTYVPEVVVLICGVWRLMCAVCFMVCVVRCVCECMYELCV